MNITPENLTSSGYISDKELGLDELVPFAKDNIQKSNPVSIFYWAYSMILVATFFWLLFEEQRIETTGALTMAFLGVFFFIIILLPLHEIIHALFYKIAGAKKVSLHAQLKRLVLYAIADRFVASMGEFMLMTMAPFLIINSILIILICLVPPNMMWVLFGALLIHTGGCYGDFGLVSYLWQKRKFKPVTYDDVLESKTFFYVKKG
jgi:hypothetical protein